ncbi:MAG: hypothetical protein ACR2HN_09635 [Tepidiformaceae bacterium]
MKRPTANHGPAFDADRLTLEVDRIRRFPGIAFNDSANGRVAVVKGTNLKAWFLPGEFRALACDFENFKSSYYWVSQKA